MSLNAQAIAVSGYGYGAQLIAVSGYGDVVVTEQPIRNFDYDDYGWARVHRKKEVEEVIQQVALRQSESLLTDEQKIYDELTRELELKGLEFEAIHLKALNYQRELFINAEIGRLLRLKLEDEEAILILMAMMI